MKKQKLIMVKQVTSLSVSSNKGTNIRPRLVCNKKTFLLLTSHDSHYNPHKLPLADYVMLKFRSSTSFTVASALV